LPGFKGQARLFIRKFYAPFFSLFQLRVAEFNLL